MNSVKIQQFADWVSVQNEIVSKVEIGNEAVPVQTKRAGRHENLNNSDSCGVPTNNRMCPISRQIKKKMISNQEKKNVLRIRKKTFYSYNL
jgi:hypothetical protein